MSIYMHNKGEWYPLVDNKIVKDGVAHEMKKNDKMVISGNTYNIGVPTVQHGLWGEDKNYGGLKLYIRNGNLYNDDDVMHPEKGWTYLSYLKGIRDGKLYYVNDYHYSLEAKVINDKYKWAMVTGMQKNYSRDSCYGYALTDNGHLYDLNYNSNGDYNTYSCDTNIHDWQIITGQYVRGDFSSTYYWHNAYGLAREGRIYALQSDSVVEIKTLDINTPKFIDLSYIYGYKQSQKSKYIFTIGLAITDDGKLYYAYWASEDMTSSTPNADANMLPSNIEGNWTYLAGNYGVCDGKIYLIHCADNTPSGSEEIIRNKIAAYCVSNSSITAPIVKISGTFNVIYDTNDYQSELSRLYVLDANGDVWMQPIDRNTVLANSKPSVYDAAKVQGLSNIVDIRYATWITTTGDTLYYGYALDNRGMLYRMFYDKAEVIGSYRE